MTTLPVRLLALILGFSLLVSCGHDKKGTGSPPPPPPSATAPTITTQPTAVTVVAGQSASFTVAASGTAPLRYQWTRNGADIAGATSATYAIAATATTDNGAMFGVVVSNSAGTVTSTAVALTVTTPAPAVATVAVDQTAILFTAERQTAHLTAHAVDANGATLPNAVTWRSTNAADVSVDTAGVITAQAIGSALLYAESDGITSPPIFVVVAHPVPGALTLTDAQVVSVGPFNVPAGTVPGMGAQYDVHVSGVSTPPAPGTAVIATERALVAGKVVSTRNEGGILVITLALAPLDQLLAEYHIDWDIDLSNLPVDEIVPPASQAAVLQNAHDVRVQSTIPYAPQAAELPGFKNFDCSGEIKAKLLSTKVDLSPQVKPHLIVQTYRDDPKLPFGYAKVVLSGTQTLVGTLSIALNAGFEAKGKCVAQGRVRLPVGGLISVLVMPAVRLGAGFEVEGKLAVVTGQLEGKGTIGASETLGFECTGGIAPSCRSLDDVSGISKFEFKSTIPSAHDMHVELSGQLFALAGVDLLVAFGLVDAEILEARAGPKQSFDLAFENDQAINRSMASSYKLDIDGVVEPGSSLQKALEALIGDENVTLDFKQPFSSPLGESPKGTLELSADRVKYGTPVQFNVNLRSETVSYPLLGPDGAPGYNVDAIKLFRKRADEAEFTEFATVPPNQSGASPSAFQYEWTPTSADVGDYEFAAFVDTTMPVPMLEVAEDSIQALHVFGPGWGGTVQFSAQGTKTDTITTPPTPTDNVTRTETTIYDQRGNGRYALEAIASGPNDAVMKVANASGEWTKSTTYKTDASGTVQGCQYTLTQTREQIETATLQSPEGSIATLNIANGTLSLLVPFLQGTSSGTDHVTAAESYVGPASCQSSTSKDDTTPLAGTLTSATLNISAPVDANQNEIKGTTTLTIPGQPDVVYTVTWDLQRF